MSEIVGREVKRWSETLEELNEYDITLVNILLKHYDDLIIDYDAYRFAFVEKNRIADFSHISVLNSKNQNERIAALFGLSAFNEFVQGFTTNFDEKYLTTSSVTEKLFEEKKLLRDSKKKRLIENKEELNKTRNLLEKEIAKLKKQEITEVDIALDYLDNPTTGILTVKIAERDKQYVALIPVEHVETFLNYILELQKNLKTVNENRTQLSDMALQVNYRNLYEIISDLEETTSCPACGTDLARTERNPFEYAKEQLQTFSEIELIQKNINDAAQSARKNIREIIDFISENQEFFKLLQIKVDNIVSVELEDVRMFAETVSRWFEFCEELKGFDKIVARNKIEEYNKAASKSNSEYNQQVAELSAIRNSLVTLKTQISEKEQIIKNCQKEIKEFDEQSEETIKKIQEEKRICEFNAKIIEAYNKIIGSLVDYNNELPRQIAQDLEQKIVDYYNMINQDDAEFEKINLHIMIIIRSFLINWYKKII